MSLHGLQRMLMVRAGAARARGLCGLLLHALVQPLWREVDVRPQRVVVRVLVHGCVLGPNSMTVLCSL